VTSRRGARSNVIIVSYLFTLLDVRSESVTDGSGDVQLSMWLLEILSGTCTYFWWSFRTESDTEESGEVQWYRDLFTLLDVRSESDTEGSDEVNDECLLMVKWWVFTYRYCPLLHALIFSWHIFSAPTYFGHYLMRTLFFFGFAVQTQRDLVQIRICWETLAGNFIFPPRSTCLVPLLVLVNI